MCKCEVLQVQAYSLFGSEVRQDEAMFSSNPIITSYVKLKQRLKEIKKNKTFLYYSAHYLVTPSSFLPVLHIIRSALILCNKA